MTLDEAYGWVAVPVRLLGTVETIMTVIGVPVSPVMAQVIVLIAEAALAAAFWWWFAARRGAPSGGRMMLLVTALGLTLSPVAIAIFWAQFLTHPPPGEIFGNVVGESADWMVELRDYRGRSMAAGNLDRKDNSFTIYYTSGLGEVPDKIFARKSGCHEIIEPLTYAQVFGPDQVTLNLQCSAN